MAAPKLTREQKYQLLEWLAAEYTSQLILRWFEERGWPQISEAALSYYRDRYRVDIEKAAAARRNSALNRGLALREERVARLCLHADELEAIKWVPDEKGHLPNEKCWRETLGEIAAEMGHRKQPVQVEGELSVKLLAPAQYDSI